MAETTPFKDEIRYSRGYYPDVPLVTQPAVGDGAIAGENVLFSRYGAVRSWRGFSPINSLGAKRLHIVDGKIAGHESGNIWRQFGNATFFIGRGNTFVDDFTTPIGVSTSQLQVLIGNDVFQGGLPKPSSPELTLAVDALGQAVAGQVTGNVSAQVTRIRTVTGAESEASDTSNVVSVTAGRIRVAFPAAITSQGQDQWGLYLSRQGLGGVGPHLLYRKIQEAEIAPFAYANVSAGAGDGVTTVYGGTTVAATNSRIAAIVLRPAAATLPSYVGSSFAVTPGGTQSIRVQRPDGALDGQYLTVMITFKASHTITPDGTNKGTDTIAAFTGVWMGGPDPLNANGEKIDILQDSQTTFKWKLRSDAIYSASLPLTTTTTILGASGFGIRWTDTATSALEVNNHFTIDLFSLVAPAGWAPSPIEWQNNPERNIGIGVFGQLLSPSVGEFYEWTTSANSQMNALAVAWKDVDSTTPTVQANSDYEVGQTAHNAAALPLGAPTATQLVTLWFTSDGPVADYTPNAPLSQITDTDLLLRFLDIDYADDDLLDIEAPRGIEPPPAGTHGFPAGPVVVIAGTLDGTGFSPSKPNQPEQYDLTETSFLNPAEQIVRLETSPYDGSTFIFTRNSLQTAFYSGDSITPIQLRTLWGTTGIAGENAACCTRTGVYCMTGRKTLARYRGNLEPDTGFADPIATQTSHWRPENTVVGFDPTLEVVAYCHGKEIYLYFETLGAWSSLLKLDLWQPVGEFTSAPISADARIVSSLTIDNRMHFVLQQGADELQYFEIFVLDVGLGGNWFLRSVARHGGAPGQMKTLRRVRLVADLSSSQELDWWRESGIHQEDDALIPDSSVIGGYAVSTLVVPGVLMETGNIRFEWTVKAPIDQEVWVAFCNNQQLNKFGVTPSLPNADYNTGAILAWRITAPGVLEWWTGGGPGIVKGVVQEGDVIRIDVTANNAGVFGYLIRNGTQVGAAHNFGYAGFAWSSWYGIKAQIVGPTGKLDMGNVSRINQTGGFRFYKNFGDKKGLANIYEKTYTESGPTHYRWAKPNKTNIVLYNCEVFGSCSDQEPSVVYLGGHIPGDSHENLVTQ